MAEKDTIFSTKLKSTGIFNFKEFYEFCYDWLTTETGLDVLEERYSEKITEDSKTVEFTWVGNKKITDYFKFEMKVEFRIVGLKDIEVKKGNQKISTNKGALEMKVKGILIRDYDGKWEKDALRKFFRGIYEKWVIQSRIEEFEGKVIGDCDEYLGQVKSWLDLEGKK